jgi:hypothetical protein
MADVPLYMNRVAGWERVTTAIAANAAELSHLESHRVQLVGILGQFRVLSSQQIALAASKQETTQEMQELFRLAETLADYLRTGVRQHYGLGSEKLVEFGLQPIRRRPRSPKPPEPPSPGSTEPGSISTTPAPLK